ncbi:MAG: glycosyltransferase, partial [Xanthomonadales bacterium]|nr:glycosyltransferase [Xanthomonadales bacterium]
MCRLLFRCTVRYVLRSVPYAITPHGVLDPWSLAHKRWKKTPYLALAERAHLAGARLIHVTSALEAQGLRALGVTDNVRRIPLAVTLPSDAPQRSMQQQGLRLLFLSRLHPVKDLETLLRAVAQLKRPEIRLTIAGEGEPRYATTLHALVRDLGLVAVVDFAGHLDDAAKRHAWHAHDVFVLPSLH